MDVFRQIYMGSYELIIPSLYSLEGLLFLC